LNVNVKVGFAVHWAWYVAAVAGAVVGAATVPVVVVNQPRKECPVRVGFAGLFNVPPTVDDNDTVAREPFIVPPFGLKENVRARAACVTEMVRDMFWLFNVAVTVTVPLLDDPLVLSAAVMVIPVAPLPPAVLDSVSQVTLRVAVQLAFALTVIVELVPPTLGAVHVEMLKLRVGEAANVAGIMDSSMDKISIKDKVVFVNLFFVCLVNILFSSLLNSVCFLTVMGDESMGLPDIAIIVIFTFTTLPCASECSDECTIAQGVAKLFCNRSS
jgi:hypothetical protein